MVAVSVGLAAGYAAVRPRRAWHGPAYAPLPALPSQRFGNDTAAHALLLPVLRLEPPARAGALQASEAARRFTGRWSCWRSCCCTARGAGCGARACPRVSFQEPEEAAGPRCAAASSRRPSLEARGLLPQGRGRVLASCELGAHTRRWLACCWRLPSRLLARAARLCPAARRREVQRAAAAAARAPWPKSAARPHRPPLFRGALRRQRPAAGAAYLPCTCASWCGGSALPDARGRRAAGRVADFRRDEPLMARLFEQFARNFYRREQRPLPRVRRNHCPAGRRPPRPPTSALLPTMLTDTTPGSARRAKSSSTPSTTPPPCARATTASASSAPHLYQLLRLPPEPGAPPPGQAPGGRPAVPRRPRPRPPPARCALHPGRPTPGARRHPRPAPALARHRRRLAGAGGPDAGPNGSTPPFSRRGCSSFS
ncbi:MAG: hypothetical protein WKG07_19380 [Hymenobacter sp.]